MPVTSTSEPRYRAGAVVLHDGRVLVSGGESTGLNSGGQTRRSAEIYEPDGNRWTPASPMTEPRSGHQLVLLKDGRVLCVGGGTSLAEIYDPAADSWATLPVGSPGRVGAAAVSLPDGRVAVVGGAVRVPGPTPTGPFYEQTTTTELLDPASGTRQPGPRLPEQRASGTGATPGDGTIVMVGGNHYRPSRIGWDLGGDRHGPVTKRTKGIDVWRPGAPAWRTVGFPSEHGGTGARAVGISSHEVLILGGSEESGASSAAFVFDTSKGSWSRTSSMHVERYHASPLVWRPGCVAVIGGAGPDDPAEVYAAADGRWLTFPKPRSFEPTSVLRLGDGSLMMLGDYYRPQVVFRFRQAP